MTSFIIRFLICNMFICGIIGIFFIVKRLIKRHLSSRMQYNLWFLMLGLLTIPFLPAQSLESISIFSWFKKLTNISGSDIGLSQGISSSPKVNPTVNWMNDFAISIDKGTSSSISLLFFGVWMTGILLMTSFIVYSRIRLNNLKCSALPLQNEEIRLLYQSCLGEMNISNDNLSCLDFSSHFQEFEGSFVLYDLTRDFWTVHNMDQATTRRAPNSTYKLYDALFGLDANAITPQSSTIQWDHKDYPFKAWNTDQNLQSAMENSVNWYFQSIDKQLGRPRISQYLQTIGYGNENSSGDLSSYWMESSLKISPVEQVELLAKLCENSLPFATETMQVAKDSIYITSFEQGAFYGKTGTGRINGQDVNGWFIGCIEYSGDTYCFATNIQGKENATGSMASDISISILSSFLFPLF